MKDFLKSWLGSLCVYCKRWSRVRLSTSATQLTPPGAQRVDELAWNTLGGSFPTLEYVMTDEEWNECALESVDMLS